MMAVVAFYLFLLLLGICLLRSLAPGLPLGWTAINGLPVGVVAFCLACCGLVIAGSSLSLAGLAVIMLALLGAVGATTRRWPSWPLRHWPTLAVVVGVVVVTVPVATIYNYANVSIDSLHYIGMGNGLALWETPPEAFRAKLRQWAFLPSVLHAPARTLGLEYLHHFYPLMSMALVANLAYWGRLQGKRNWLLIVCLVGAYALVPQVTVMMLFVAANLPFALFLLAFVQVLQLAAREPEREWPLLAAVMAFGMATSRFEGLAIAGMILALAGLNLRLSLRQLQVVAMGLLLPACWNLYLATLPVAGGTTIASTKVALALAVGAGTLALVTLALSEPTLTKVRRYGLQISGAGIGAVLIACAVLNWQVTYDSIANTMVNLTVPYLWDGFWAWSLGLLVLGHLLAKPAREIRFQGTVLLTLVAFILLMAVVRNGAYRVSWFDSANRMIAHSSPLVILYLLTQLSQVRGSRSG